MSYSEATQDWANEWDKCWKCGKRGAWIVGTLDIHHVVRGCNRDKDNLATTAIACQSCHDTEHNGDGIGLLGWLVLKRKMDRENWNLAEVCRARGRALTSITEADVDRAERELLRAGRIRDGKP